MSASWSDVAAEVGLPLRYVSEHRALGDDCVHVEADGNYVGSFLARPKLTRDEMINVWKHMEGLRLRATVGTSEDAEG